VRSADAPRPRRRRECIKIYSPKRYVCSRRVAACATLVGGCPIAVRPVVRIHTFLRGLLPLERRYLNPLCFSLCCILFLGVHVHDPCRDDASERDSLSNGSSTHHVIIHPTSTRGSGREMSVCPLPADVHLPHSGTVHVCMSLAIFRLRS
jgi:hypothetical protein